MIFKKNLIKEQTENEKKVENRIKTISINIEQIEEGWIRRGGEGGARKRWNAGFKKGRIQGVG